MRAFTVVDAAQRSPEWFAARVGHATGSKADCITAKIKSGEAAARRDYRAQLVAERLTGQPQDSDFVNADIQRGIDLEAEARAAFEAETGHLVTETGFLRHADLMAGCSLDGHFDDFRRVIEIKCPRVATHLATLRDGKLPSRYVAQVTHNVWLSGAEACYFVSYCNALPAHLRLAIVEVTKEELDLAGYEQELRRFLYEVALETAEFLNFRKAA